LESQALEDAGGGEYSEAEAAEEDDSYADNGQEVTISMLHGNLLKRKPG
jgi:hypothetical protein